MSDQPFNAGVPNLRLISGTKNCYRGGQPINDDGWNFLKTLGVKTVVKLNTEAEGTDIAAEALGWDLIYRPINTCEQLIFKPNRDSVLEAATALAGDNVFVHCEHGQDRTGLVVGCFRVWHQGQPKDVAWDEMITNGFHPALLGLTLFWEWCV